METAKPSAIVGFASTKTGLPAFTAAEKLAQHSDSTPMTFTEGLRVFTATDIPDIRLPPPTGTTITSTSGTWSKISIPVVPWPAMMSGLS